MNKFILSCTLILTFSCTVPEKYGSSLTPEQQQEKSKLQYQKTGVKTENSEIRFIGGDGSSMENAIIIRGAKNEIEGIPAEIDYISRKHGERDKFWKMIMQSNFVKNGKPYIEYQIEDYKNGIKTTYFFDNTALYSAYLETTGPSSTPKEQTEETPLPDKTAGLKTENSGIRFIGGDGSSMENAIIIRGAKNEKEGLAAEIDYISRKHGERDKFWKMKMQNNIRKNGTPYVEYVIEDYKNGNKTSYYFDNTALYSAIQEVIGTPLTPKEQTEETPLPDKTAGMKTKNSEIRFNGGDGSSMENATIIIGAKNEKEVLAAEIDYISRKHGERGRYWKIVMQSNFRENNRYYDEFNIKDLKNDSRTSYYFDITAFSGK